MSQSNVVHDLYDLKEKQQELQNFATCYQKNVKPFTQPHTLKAFSRDMTLDKNFFWIFSLFNPRTKAQLAGAVEYTNCISAKE